MSTLIAGGVAHAHADFESSSPAAGEVLDDPVGVITFVFTAEVTPVGDGFVALTPDGVVQSPASVETVDDTTFRVRFDPPLVGGEVGVRWNVRSSDTHVIEGAFAFSVAAPAPTTVSPTTVSVATVAPETTVPPASTVPLTTVPVAAAPAVVEPAPAAVTQSLDEFLAVDESTAGSTVATTGRVITLLGVALGLGGMAFVAAVLRGTRGEIRRALGVVRILGAVIAVGAVFEYLGVAQLLDRSIDSTWRAAPGFATLLRFVGGIGIAVGLASTMSDAGGRRAPHTLSAAVIDDVGQAAPATGTHPPTESRWTPDIRSAAAIAGVVLILASFWFDGHTVSQGWRPMHALVNTVHIAAGAVWVGGVVAVTGVAWTRRRARADMQLVELLLRFSKIATIALVAVALAGGVMAVLVLDSFGDLTATPWGQTLLLKTAAVLVASGLGAINHFALLPALERDPSSSDRHASLRSKLIAESIVLVFVVVVTAWLVAAATS